MDYCEEGNYLELNRVFDCIDFDYLEGLFEKDSVIDFIKESEKRKIEEAATAVVEELNREQKRSNTARLWRFIRYCQ